VGRLVRFAAVVSLVPLLLTACGGGDGSGQRSAAGDQQYVSGPGVVTRVPVGDRQPLPRVRGELLDGGEFDSADYAGEILVFNVWGSWCPPCRAEAPALRQVWEETRERGVQFVGINIRDDRAAARAFERRFGITYPSVFDPAARLLLQFRTTLPPNAIPSTIVVDRQGKVAARVVGGTTYEKLRAVVDGVLTG